MFYECCRSSYHQWIARIGLCQDRNGVMWNEIVNEKERKGIERGTAKRSLESFSAAGTSSVVSGLLVCKQVSNMPAILKNPDKNILWINGLSTLLFGDEIISSGERTVVFHQEGETPCGFYSFAVIRTPVICMKSRTYWTKLPIDCCKTNSSTREIIYTNIRH